MKRLTIQKGATNITVADATTEFMRHCKVKNLSPQTIRYYEGVLKIFQVFLGADVSMQDVDSDVIDSFILRQQECTSDVSVNTRLRGVRAFLYYCMSKGYCSSFKIRLTKQNEVLKMTYTDEELQLLLKKPDLKGCSFTDYRNWAVVNFLLGTAVRVSTLINIKVADIDLTESILLVRHAKNRRQCVIPISRSLNKVLVEYLTYRNHENGDEYMFCNQYGKKLTPEALEHAVTKYGKRKGVEGVSCHRFRHTFSKNYILEGGDVFRLQKILGHSTMEMVKKYVNLYGNEVSKDFNRYNILERVSQDKTVIKMEKGNRDGK